MSIGYGLSLKDIATVIVALVGWLVVHRLTISRDIFSSKRSQESMLEQERRNLRAKYLIDVYRSLELTPKPNLDKEEGNRFKQAVIDIQFLGKNQVELLKEYVTVKVSTGDTGKSKCVFLFT
ncbi:hypothetical protein KDW99_12515 [Marinomonas rhizomae]|uniref:hypothetical protein n=1 Tax=Marinomonas rhizomae TaxID=491948 RepID=UPI0021028886|nr:hypothetical protein [Marinomonas rhizomae]UTV98098.1 hypothetical protein KDW99_12515 [Marinomonas rhizomae]